MIGKTLAHFHVVRKLGSGGMGDVYLAHDTVLSRFVALKLLPSGASFPDQVKRLIDEATATSALNHPNIATIHDLQVDRGIHFIVMEYVEGETLKAKVTRGPLDSSEIVKLATQIALALDAAHSVGIIHCDIKSSNIIITPRGYAKVLDFGLARRTAPPRPRSHDTTFEAVALDVVMGTVAYMSPEQALGKSVDQRSDLFSLGVVLYEMATGRLPFSGATPFESIDATLHADPIPISSINPNIPADLQRVIMRCLERRTEDRVQTATELARDLRNSESRHGRTPVPGDSITNNLPQLLTRFVGRLREIAEIRNEMRQRRLLTLSGPGGIGKTRLALQVAADSLDEYPDGVFVVELASLTDPGLVPHTAASALGLREEGARSITDILVGFLKPKCLLLVMDNCEHLIGACAELITLLLRSSPHLTVLATSRESLAINGEFVIRVPPLALPDAAEQPDVKSLSRYDAVALFVDRARAVASTFAINDANAHRVAKLCEQLDGIPLAIELAASRMKVLSLEQILARLGDRLHLLTGGSRTALPRHQTLLAAIDWSYNLLTEAEKILFRRLSVFVGGWTLEQAEIVCAAQDVPQSSVLELLSGLVDKSLVLVEERDGQQRHRFMVTLLEYAHKQLTQAEESDALARRHASFFLSFAIEAGSRLTGKEQKVWLERLNAEHDNLRVALTWTLRHDPDMGLQLVGALGGFWYLRGYWDEGLRWLTQILASDDSPAHAAHRARALNEAARIANHQGKIASARSFAERALALSRDAGQQREAAAALNSLAVIAGKQGDFALARSLVEESLAIWQELGDQASVALTLNNAGIVAIRLGDLGAAQSRFEDSLAISREVGNKHGTAMALLNRGYVAMRTGDHKKAQSLTEEALTLANEIGDKALTPGALNSLGDLAGAHGDEVIARALHREALDAARDLGDSLAIAHALLSLGTVAENDQTARPLFEESLSIRRELGDGAEIATALNWLGTVRAREGDHAAAMSLHEEGLAICRRSGVKDGIAQSLSGLANVARLRLQYTQALELYKESLRIWRELGEKPEFVRPLEHVAEVLIVSGQYDWAVRLYGAVDALRNGIPFPRRPSEAAEYELNITAAERATGKDAFATAWTQGQAMSAEQAVDNALQAKEI